MTELSLDLDSEVANLLGQIELGYWKSNQVQQNACVDLLSICLRAKHPLLGYAYILHGRSLLISGEVEEAQIKIKKGIKVCQQNRDCAHLALGWLWKGIVHERLTELIDAYKSWSACFLLSIEQDNLDCAIEAYINLAYLYHQAGLSRDSLRLFENCFSMIEMLDNKKLLAKSGIHFSSVLIAVGDYDGALSIIDRVEIEVILYSDITWIVQICKNKAECLWRTNRLDDANQCYESGRLMANRFEMFWAYIDISLSYVELLQEINDYDHACLVVEEVEPCFSIFEDDQLRLKWLRLKYLCCKNKGFSKEALDCLKKIPSSPVSGLNVDQSKIAEFLLNKLDDILHDFKKCDRLVEQSGTRMTKHKLKEFIDRCSNKWCANRIVELIVRAKDTQEVWQRVARIIYERCTNHDLWICVSAGHYYIYPGTNSASLFEFSRALSAGIELQPWTRLGVGKVQVRSRILMVDEALLSQLKNKTERGWHRA
ncbi:hypothetical protein NT239_06355 [Chitinibacter sp. SCUT-21]|uniref:hypothetical protein n=1 Tax=Chitinibacter sp. SCUT-21 TaxID=2970891 RepID=UPI0035A62298